MKAFAEYLYRSRYFIFCLSLSAVVVFWDILFSIDHFGVNKYLACLMMIQVELSYIFLPYMQEPEIVDNKKKKKKGWFRIPSFNKVMVVVFFIASMTPAALQISSQLMIKILDSITTEPTIPKKPEKIEIDRDIATEEWNKRMINSNDKIADEEKKYYIKKLDKRIGELKDQKGKFSDALNQYNIDIQEYPEKKRKYDEFIAKGKYTWFIDYASLILGFVIMVSLQVMNGYSSRRGAEERKKYNDGLPFAKGAKAIDLNKTIKHDSVKVYPETDKGLVGINIDDGDTKDPVGEKIEAAKNLIEPGTPISQDQLGNIQDELNKVLTEANDETIEQREAISRKILNQELDSLIESSKERLQVPEGLTFDDIKLRANHDNN